MKVHAIQCPWPNITDIQDGAQNRTPDPNIYKFELFALKILKHWDLSFFVLKPKHNKRPLTNIWTKNLTPGARGVTRTCEPFIQPQSKVCFLTGGWLLFKTNYPKGVCYACPKHQRNHNWKFVCFWTQPGRNPWAKVGVAAEQGERSLGPSVWRRLKNLISHGTFASIKRNNRLQSNRPSHPRPLWNCSCPDHCSWCAFGEMKENFILLSFWFQCHFLLLHLQSLESLSIPNRKI